MECGRRNPVDRRCVVAYGYEVSPLEREMDGSGGCERWDHIARDHRDPVLP